MARYECSIDLFSLPPKKRTAFLQRLSAAGFTSHMLLAALDAPDDAFVYWVRQCPRGEPAPSAKAKRGIVYDAVSMSRIHGIPIHCTDPAPLATRDGIVGYYDGWDLQTERASVAGKKCMKQDQNWYEKYGWKTEPGYYEVLFGLAKSISPNWDQKMVCLNGLQKEDPAWQVCPIVVGAPILLAHLSETGEDLLDGDICLFAEMLRDSDRAGLSVVHGYVVAGCRWVGYRFKDFSFAVCRKL